MATAPFSRCVPVIFAQIITEITTPTHDQDVVLAAACGQCIAQRLMAKGCREGWEAIGEAIE